MKSILAFSFCLLFVYTSCFAQEIIPLWKENTIPNYQKSEGKEEVIKQDIIRIKNVQTPTLEIFLPAKRNANGMAVLICPGGGYGNLSYDWEGIDYAKWLNSLGIAAFVLKYRMPQAESVITSYKAPIQDAQRAMRYIRFNADDFNIDKNNLGVIGSSAGGHLASTLAIHDANYYDLKDEIDTEEKEPNFQMLIYPVISMKKGVTHMGSRNSLLGKNPSEALELQFSNELQVTTNTPPTFIIHSGDDKAVPVENSLRLYQALLNNNVNTTMHIYPEGGHGYSLGKSKESAPDWSTLAEQWLAKQNK
ncbi:MAG: alpha/beta hydrolase [Urechidicola sp.]|nr:alpha/beta hydrolase [Urechidicola sp.]